MAIKPILILVFSFFTFTGFSSIYNEVNKSKIEKTNNETPVFQGYIKKIITFTTSDFQKKIAPQFQYKLTNTKNARIKTIRVKVLDSEKLKHFTRDNGLINKTKITPVVSTEIIGENKIFTLDFPTIVNQEIVKSIELEIEWETFLFKQKPLPTYPDNSPLSSGTWYKIGTLEKGVYKITGTQLKANGVVLAEIEPKRLKLFGQNNGMLPEIFSTERPLGLIENSIEINDGGDNKFDEQDYILFYSSGPDNTFYDNNLKAIRYKTNIYSDSAFYFLNFDLEFDGKRIQNSSNTTSSTSQNVTSYDEYWYHEKQTTNLDHTGREWFGERFDITKTYEFTVPSPNRVVGDTVYIEFRSIANSTAVSQTNFTVNNSDVLSLSIPKITNTFGYPPKAVQNGFANHKSILPGAQIQFSLNFDNKGVQNAFGYIDYILLNYRNNLVFDNNQTHFRDYKSFQNGGTAKFGFSTIHSDLKIWNITDNNNINNQIFSSNSFTTNVDNLKEFIAFSENNVFQNTTINTVENQNLHGIDQADYILIYPTEFKESALELKKFHEDFSGYKVAFTSTQEIYNEFSSGKQDLTALRDFIGMLYHRNKSINKQPKAVMLFGDASYDYKNYNANNSNFVPTWEDQYSMAITNSNATDDYIVCLDSNDGDILNHTQVIDVPVGRLIIQTNEQGVDMVNKIKAYKNFDNRGPWQSRISLVTDDVDVAWERDDLTRQADQIIEVFKTQNPNFNINKIYSDAFQQVNSSGGQRYPDVEKVIDDAVLKGSLIVHYYGHGGESGWATERILDIETINSWDNIKNLPAFVTTTCEFTRYDDLNRVSAGEYVQLNPKGGAIGLFTSTRQLTTFDANRISDKFYEQLVNRNASNEYPTMGEILMRVKRNYKNSNSRRFILIGDPGITLNYPEKDIKLIEVNSEDINSPNIDTLKALSKISFKGEVKHSNGVIIDDFNGQAFIEVFDKIKVKTTLNNDNVVDNNGIEISTLDFYTQTNKVFKGQAEVVDGKFQVDFIVPKDIDFNIGKSKISMYAKSDDEDAWGVDTNLYVGGIISNPAVDNQGPDIRLFMNDSSFISGGITSNNPDIYAILFDENGINAVGTGVGHDISAVLDAETSNPIILNDFYQTFPNSFKRGEVLYPLNDLENGEHTLSLKAWDNYNNSNSEQITFIVTDEQDLTISNVGNIPNPLRDFTDFQFEHNYENRDLEVTIEIYDVSGKLRKTLNQLVPSAPSRVNNTLTWEGTSSYGDPLNSGLYIYRLIVKSVDDGKIAKKSEKLVIIK